jgi:hypothetical protein
MAGKVVIPRVSLGTLFLSVQFADALWPVLLLAGIEHVRIVAGLMRTSPLDFWDYPIRQSLVALLAWGLLFGAIYFLSRRSFAAAVVLAVGVVSHWLLNVVMHRPDVAVLPRGPYLGLGLWNCPSGTLAVEGLLYALGATVYLRTTRSRDAVGNWALAALLVLLPVVWLLALLGPPPPSEGSSRGRE